MTRRTRIALAAAIAAVAVPAIVLAATATYTSLTLRVSNAGPATVISASGNANDDATAEVSIYVPSGTTVTTSQAPGATLGTAKAQAIATALAGAVLPLDGTIVVAPAGAISTADQTACIEGATPAASWLLRLTAAGNTINVPVYVLSTVGAETAFGPAKIVACLQPPDIPVEKGGAPFGAKIVSATFTFNGVFSQVTQGAWIALWTPWHAGTGQPNPEATVASPAAIAPGAVTVNVRKAGPGAVVSGKVTQAGQGRPGTVAIWGARGKAVLKKLGSVKASAAGTFSFRARTGDVFQARVVAGPIAAPPLCQLISAQLSRIPCVNPTANGFVAKSASVKKR